MERAGAQSHNGKRPICVVTTTHVICLFLSSSGTWGVGERTVTVTCRPIRDNDDDDNETAPFPNKSKNKIV